MLQPVPHSLHSNCGPWGKRWGEENKMKKKVVGWVREKHLSFGYTDICSPSHCLRWKETTLSCPLHPTKHLSNPSWNIPKSVSKPPYRISGFKLQTTALASKIIHISCSKWIAVLDYKAKNHTDRLVTIKAMCDRGSQRTSWRLLEECVEKHKVKQKSFHIHIFHLSEK